MPPARPEQQEARQPVGQARQQRRPLARPLPAEEEEGEDQRHQHPQRLRHPHRRRQRQRVAPPPPAATAPATAGRPSAASPPPGSGSTAATRRRASARRTVACQGVSSTSWSHCSRFTGHGLGASCFHGAPSRSISSGSATPPPNSTGPNRIASTTPQTAHTRAGTPSHQRRSAHPSPAARAREPQPRQQIGRLPAGHPVAPGSAGHLRAILRWRRRFRRPARPAGSPWPPRRIAADARAGAPTLTPPAVPC